MPVSAIFDLGATALCSGGDAAEGQAQPGAGTGGVVVQSYKGYKNALVHLRWKPRSIVGDPHEDVGRRALQRERDQSSGIAERITDEIGEHPLDGRAIAVDLTRLRVHLQFDD